MANLTLDVNVYHYFSPDLAQLAGLITNLDAKMSQLSDKIPGPTDTGTGLGLPLP